MDRFHLGRKLFTGNIIQQTMKQCILHVGSPKTGTSSIQSSLYYGLNDSRFQYISFGMINAGTGIITLFGDDADKKSIVYINSVFNLKNKGKLNSFKVQLNRRLARSIRRAQKYDSALVISAEVCWRISAEALERIRNYFEDQGYQVKIVVYLRPWLAFLSSGFTQAIKSGIADFNQIINPEILSYRVDYVGILHRFQQVFGKDQVLVRIYDRRQLLKGCVVNDFFHLIGAKIDPKRIEHSNESIGLEACRVLYTYNYCTGFSKCRNLAKRDMLINVLKTSLPSKPLKVHSSLLAPSVWNELQKQQQCLKDSFGISLPLDPDDDADAIQSEQDLLAVDPQSLVRLAKATGRSRFTQRFPEDESIEATLVLLLRAIERYPGASNLIRFGRDRIRGKWRSIRYAC